MKSRKPPLPGLNKFACSVNKPSAAIFCNRYLFLFLHVSVLFFSFISTMHILDPSSTSKYVNVYLGCHLETQFLVFPVLLYLPIFLQPG